MERYMDAIVKPTLGPGLELQKVPVPTPGPGEVLIKVHKTAICGTDVHIYNWDPWAVEHIKPPMTIGHEYVGEIAAMGDVWAAFTGRKPYFNYCVNTDNNGADGARRLASLFNPDVWECTLSVICEKDESVANSIERQLDIISNFRKVMEDEGFHLRVFNPAGQDDIGGGCGQLWYFQKWLKANL